jgi:hypothetical protein
VLTALSLSSSKTHTKKGKSHYVELINQITLHKPVHRMQTPKHPRGCGCSIYPKFHARLKQNWKTSLCVSVAINSILRSEQCFDIPVQNFMLSPHKIFRCASFQYKRWNILNLWPHTFYGMVFGHSSKFTFTGFSWHYVYPYYEYVMSNGAGCLINWKGFGRR